MVIASMSTALLVLTTKTFYNTPLPIDVIVGQLLLFIQSCVFLTSKLAFSILYLNGYMPSTLFIFLKMLVFSLEKTLNIFYFLKCYKTFEMKYSVFFKIILLLSQYKFFFKQGLLFYFVFVCCLLFCLFL